MKVVGVIFGIVGIVFVLLLLGTVSGNRDLATPGPSLLVGLLPANWRLLVGPFCLFAAIFLTAGWIAARRLPGYSWLALLVFFILGVPYLILPGLLTNAVTLMIVALILVIGVPIVTAVIASAIGRAARKRAAAQ